MSRKQPRIPVHLDTQGIKSLEPEEIAAIGILGGGGLQESQGENQAGHENLDRW